MVQFYSRCCCFSSIIIGLHAILELAVGAGIFAVGHYEYVSTTGALIAVTGPSKLFARFHGGSLFSFGVLGALGLKADPATTDGKAVRDMVIWTCMLFHMLAVIAAMMATVDDKGESSVGPKVPVETWGSATVANLHLYFALGFVLALPVVQANVKQLFTWAQTKIKGKAPQTSAATSSTQPSVPN